MIWTALGVAVSGLVGLEWAWTRLRHREGYSLARTVDGLACGAGAVVGGTAISMFWLYEVVQATLAPVWWSSSSAWTWIGAVLLLDVVFYWAHRLSHQVGALWALHVVHHQSDEYNLVAGLRAPWLQPLLYAPFTMVLALAGVPVEVMGPVYLAQQAWKWLVHTEVVRDLGPLGLIFVTPGQHAVHHSTTGGGRNFGGLLNIWDRVFGTFADAAEQLEYGNGAGTNPVENNLGPAMRWLRS